MENDEEKEEENELFNELKDFLYYKNVKNSINPSILMQRMDDISTLIKELKKEKYNDKKLNEKFFISKFYIENTTSKFRNLKYISFLLSKLNVFNKFVETHELNNINYINISNNVEYKLILRNKYVFHYNDVSDNFYLILKGKVKIIRPDLKYEYLYNEEENNDNNEEYKPNNNENNENKNDKKINNIKSTLNQSSKIMNNINKNQSINLKKSNNIKESNNSNSNNKKRVILYLNEGDYFGDWGLSEYKKRKASILAEENSILLYINKDVFMKYLLKELNISINKQKKFLIKALPIFNIQSFFDTLYKTIEKFIFKKNEKVFQYKDEANNIFFIYKGQVNLAFKNRNLLMLEEGEFFGLNSIKNILFEIHKDNNNNNTENINNKNNKICYNFDAICNSNYNLIFKLKFNIIKQYYNKRENVRNFFDNIYNIRMNILNKSKNKLIHYLNENKMSFKENIIKKYLTNKDNFFNNFNFFKIIEKKNNINFNEKKIIKCKSQIYKIKNHFPKTPNNILNNNNNSNKNVFNLFKINKNIIKIINNKNNIFLNNLEKIKIKNRLLKNNLKIDKFYLIKNKKVNDFNTNNTSNSLNINKYIKNNISKSQNVTIQKSFSYQNFSKKNKTVFFNSGHFDIPLCSSLIN